MVNVAINGFGRIGRIVLRIGLQDKDINFVAINDLTDTKTMAHLFKYDSVHGTYKGDVTYDDNNIIIDGKKILYVSEKDPEKLPWGDNNVDVVVESTGRFTKFEDAKKHLDAGAKKVLLSAPGKGEDIMTVVRGVNDEQWKEKDIVSNASCTTNSLAPIVKVLDKLCGIDKGFMSTVHAYTNDQRILDFPHKDFRRSRTGATNIIPTTTGAAKTVGKVMPEMDGKLDGLSFRVPIPCGSITDFTFIAKQDTTVEDVNNAVKAAAEGEFKGIIQYTEEDYVSSDILGNSHSSIFDSQLTKVNGNLVKVSMWYDNEWGFSTRMVEMLKEMNG